MKAPRETNQIKARIRTIIGTTSIYNIIITLVGLLDDSSLFKVRLGKYGFAMVIEPNLTANHLEEFHVNISGHAKVATLMKDWHERKKIL